MKKDSRKKLNKMWDVNQDQEEKSPESDLDSVTVGLLLNGSLAGGEGLTAVRSRKTRGQASVRHDDVKQKEKRNNHFYNIVKTKRRTRESMESYFDKSFPL